MDQNARDNAITAAWAAVAVVRDSMAHLETLGVLEHGDIAAVMAVTGEDPPDTTARRHALVMVRQMHAEAARALASGRECIAALKAYVEVL